MRDLSFEIRPRAIIATREERMKTGPYRRRSGRGSNLADGDRRNLRGKDTCTEGHLGSGNRFWRGPSRGRSATYNLGSGLRAGDSWEGDRAAQEWKVHEANAWLSRPRTSWALERPQRQR